MKTNKEKCAMEFTKFNSMEDFKESLHKDDTWFDKFMLATWWPFYRFCADFKWKYIKGIKRFIQRGYRGYADSDTWSLDSYLSGIIISGVKTLKKNKMGHPAELKNMKEWHTILDKIIYTFEIEKDAANSDVFIPANLKEFLKVKKSLAGTNIKVLTGSECRKYEQGWELFRKFYRGLWD